MLMRKHRFHGYNSLRYAYSNSRPIKGRWFSLRAAPNPKRDTYRVAIVVSKKVHKSAVVRNRIRRRLYETIRKEQALNITKPIDIIVSVYDVVAAEAPQAEVSQEIKTLFKKANVSHK